MVAGILNFAERCLLESVKEAANSDIFGYFGLDVEVLSDDEIWNIITQFPSDSLKASQNQNLIKLLENNYASQRDFMLFLLSELLINQWSRR